MPVWDNNLGYGPKYVHVESCINQCRIYMYNNILLLIWLDNMIAPSGILSK
jgi:hypothetical protein